MTEAGAPPDRELVRRVRAGEAGAFRELVLRYERPVLRFARSFGFAPESAEELAQEAFARAHAALGELDREERGASFGAWVFTIVRHLALNERARAWRSREIGASSSPGLERAYLSARDERSGLDPERALAAGESLARLRAALVRLPTEFRRAIEGWATRGETLEEIARAEGCSTGTVKSRIFRGKERLRRELDDGGAGGVR